MSEQVRITLGEALEILIDHRGKTPTKLGGDWSDSGIRVVSAINIKDRRIDQDNLRYVPEDIFERWMPIKLKRGDVLLTSEAPLGEVARVRDDEPICLGQRLFGLRGKPGLLDGGYLYYLLGWGEPRDEILGRATGTTVGGIRQSELVRVQLKLPPVAEQRAIAGVLGALDDKIESNRRISATARSLCDAVFQANTDTEERLSAVSIVTMGSSPPGDTYNNRGDGLPFYQGVTDFGFLSPSRRVWTSNPIRIAETGSTLISVRAPVGRLNEAGEKCCIGRGVASASSKNQVVLYYALRQADAVWAPFESEGTVFGSINRSDLEDAKIPWISGSRIDQVEVDLRAIHGRIRAAAAEIVTLEEVRDALLPELLSGRLRVRDAETVVEGAL